MARWHALWLKPDLSPEIEREVNIERLMTMVRHQPVAAPAHALNSIVLAVAGWPVVEQKWLLILVALVFQAAAIWQLHSWWVHRHSARPSRVTERTINRATLWSVGFGAAWGLFSTILLMTEPGPRVELLIYTLIAGTAAGGAMMTYTIPACMLGFLVLCLLPPWIAVGITDDHISKAVMYYTVVYAGFLMVTGCYSYTNFVEGVRLRIQNAELAYKAEAASRAKSRFLANMSHELRTPLNAIIGFAEMIHNQFKGPVGNPQYVEFARAIHDSGRHLVGIINDILDLSKVESGQVDLEEGVTTITALVDRAVGLMQQAVGHAQLTVEVAIQPGLPSVLVDAHKFDQVLLNLLSNAVKFTAPGGRIRFEGRRAADGGVTIRIADTGVGIAADEIDEVMKPFVQSRDAERNTARGTGLGLPMADQLIKLHGGVLTLASTLGAGTTVTLHLPASRVLDHSPIKGSK